MNNDKKQFDIQEFYFKNKTFINYSLVIIGLIIGGIYYYFEKYKKPLELEASEKMFMAQKFFKEDSLESALNGKGLHKGFLFITKNYSSTDAANLAHYYLGIIYLKQGQYKKAIENLETFSTKSNLLEGYKQVLLADAKSELKEYDKAVSLYTEASEILKNDDAMGSKALYKAAILLETQKKNEEAIKLYKKLIENFPGSNQRTEAEKSLARLGAQLLE